MNKSEILQKLGFEFQDDLGINTKCAGWFFQFNGQTFAFDENGNPWILKGLMDPGEIFFFARDPILWESELAT